MTRTTADKLKDLRREMAARHIDAFYIPRADEFQGEYVPAANDRLAWITGFSGSAGTAIVTMTEAAFFTDGRYTIQAQAEVDAGCFKIYSTAENQHPTPTMSPAGWIEFNLPKGARLGIDPWLHTPADATKIKEAADRANGSIVYVESNPLDAAWGKDRPAMPQDPAIIHPLKYAGEDSADKRQRIATTLREKTADTLLVTMPEDICWLLNIRGSDVPCTPFVLSYALLHADASVDWFVDTSKISPAVIEWIGDSVRIHPLPHYACSVEKQAMDKKTLWIDPHATAVFLHDLAAKTGATVIAEKSPIPLIKAQKNAVEIAGSIAAHVRDGVAVTRFLSALAEQGAPARFDEISAANMLHDFRAEDPLFRGPSFDTISGAGGNGAIVHYRATPDTNKPLLAGPVYLVDSGGQYSDGTTDITRTLAVDTPTEEMRDRFTRVLKGHIQVAMAEFPAGTTGHILDALARAALQEIGLDYAHGTGHGVGSYLSVHEGPCGISPLAKTVPLLPGMILSNEPGYYKTGAYGIRIENLITVVDAQRTDAEGRKLYAFETLTLAPIDRNLIEVALLTAAERAWLNAYHARVRETLLPLLNQKDPKAAAFLLRATEPL